MEFWIFFFGIALFIYLLSIMLKPLSQRYILYIYVIFIWFIGAFRKNIGTDYSTYENMYDIWPMCVHDLYFFDNDIEPTFSFIVGVLHAFEFHSQMLFVVYETLIVLFLYLGATKYLQYSFCILIFMLLYVVFPTSGGYWWELNAMRQAAAISVAFYSSYFYERKKYLFFIIGFILACGFHYSAIISMVLFLLKNRIPMKLVSVLLILGFILNATGITSQIVLGCAVIVSDIVGKYEYASLMAVGGTVLFSITAAYLSLLYLVSFFYLSDKNVSPLILNGASIYILLRVYMSFGLDGSILFAVVHRFEAYFLPFYLLLLVMAMGNFITKFKFCWQSILVTSMVFVIFIVMAINTVYLQQNDILAKIAEGASLGNIDYRMSFDLL